MSAMTPEESAIATLEFDVKSMRKNHIAIHMGQQSSQMIPVVIHCGLFRSFQINNMTIIPITKIRMPTPREPSARYLLSMLCQNREQ